jgi:ATP-dependent DNA helicase DinG
MRDLGRWAVIDIETTGVDPSYDQIIDLGFLQFEGTKLIKQYSSLVRTEVKLSQFIQKLTGIKQEQINNAPMWSKVELDLLDLEGHQLIAHNSSFEKTFLGKYFENLGDERELEYYQDSMYYLALLYPERGSLNLESILIDLKIAEKEEHRGLSDSIDLLKVMLLSTYSVKHDKEFEAFLKNSFSDFTANEFWFKTFIELDRSELIEIAEQINFDLEASFKVYMEVLSDNHLTNTSLEKSSMAFTGDNIKSILRDEDKLKQNLESYTFRETQEKLSLRIGQAFGNSIHALIQAPTGTGKTLGYLLPAVLLAKSKDEQVLISTGTKALQNQAMIKDIPLVFRMLGLNKYDLNVVRLIGSKNHYCELLYRNNLDENENLLDLSSFGERMTKAYFELVFFYNERVTNYSDIITKDTIPFVMKRKFSEFQEKEEAIRVDYRACTGHKCPYKGNCTYLTGMRKAKEADLIVGNHALLMTWPKAVDKPNYIVIDEAHKIESESTQSFTQELSQKDLENFAKNMPQMIAPVYYLLGEVEKGAETSLWVKREIASSAKIIQENFEGLKDYIERYAKKLPRFTDIYWNEFPMINEKSMNSNLEVSIFNHIDSLRYIFKGVNDIITPLLGKWNLNSLNDDNQITAFTLFESFVAHVDDTLTTLTNLLEEQKTRAGSIKFHEEYGFMLSSAPINVGELFYDAVIKDAESVILTSATLANSDGSRGMAQVEWMTGYNLLPAERRFKQGLFLENSYDYENNAKVYLCTDTPTLYDQKFVPTVMDKLVPLIRDLGGRSLLLFSARTRFDKAREILLQAFDGEIPVFVQGMGNNVVEEFKKSQNGILLGMESFGEGIDIPGDNLEFVYIDKVPDLRQDLVIQKRRDFYDANFGNEFNDYFLAHRTRSLHQKLGRLIRRESDKGCVIVTDSRLSRWKGRTLDTFKDMMKPYQIQITDLDDACEKTKDFLL